MIRNVLHIAMSLTLAASLQAGAESPPEGFEALFNGTDLAGWWGLGTEDPAEWMALQPDVLEGKRQASLADIQAHWRAKSGELINDGHGLYLTTAKHFADFELRLEYRISDGSDSGVYLRGVPQVQIWDPDDPKKKKHGGDKGSGGLWNNKLNQAARFPVVRADRPIGQWNELRVVMIGERVTVELNGQRVVDHARLENYFARTKPIPRSGPIQLQTHGGETGWRHIYIREIGVEEANQRLAQAYDDAYRPLFDGVSLEGWTGAVDSYEVVDGSIRCRRKGKGNLFTEKVYGDFAIHFEFTVPPAGNNGLAIRYPGSGRPAYDGMCELQVLDNTSSKYANLDPRQYHGSAYGMAPAHRGYLRNAGQWNFQWVRVVGSTIHVELNGTRILDTDLAEITEFAQDKLHPGRTRTEGHLGFAGHGNPVAFRNLNLKENP